MNMTLRNSPGWSGIPVILLLSGLLLWGLLFSGEAAAVPDKKAWTFWDVQGARSIVDHSPWQRFLDRYLVEGADGINRIRYSAVAADDRAQLDAYLAGLSDLDPRTLTAAAQQAYWINFYNALTVRVVLDYPRKRSILRMGRKLLAIGPWDDEVANVQGQRLTLNDIEHRILRPLYGDERVHFAVNCASTGCPNLAAQVYSADTLDQLLERQMREYLAHPRGLRLAQGKLVASSIFDWYSEDFGPSETAVRAWLAARQPGLAEALLNPDVDITYDYDWSLNGVQ